MEDAKFINQIYLKEGVMTEERMETKLQELYSGKL